MTSLLTNLEFKDTSVIQQVQSRNQPDNIPVHIRREKDQDSTPVPDLNLETWLYLPPVLLSMLFPGGHHSLYRSYVLQLSWLMLTGKVAWTKVVSDEMVYSTGTVHVV